MAVVAHPVARYRWVILGVALVTHLMGTLGGAVLAPLAPLFRVDLGLTRAEVGLFAAVFYAGVWSISLVGGSLTDRFGARAVMAAGLAASGVVLMAMPLSTTAVQAAAVMFAAGAARGSVFPGTTKAILEWFAPTVRATAMGVKQTGAPAAGVLAAAALPALGLVIGWRAAIAVAGAAITAAGAVVLLYRDPPSARGARPARTGMRAGMGTVLRSRKLWALGCMSMLYMFAQNSLIVYVPLYFNDELLGPLVPEREARIVAAGGYLALCQFGGVFGRLFWGMASDRLFGGRRGVVLSLIGALSVVMMVAMGLLGPGSSLWLLGTITFVAGSCAIGWNAVGHTLISELAGPKYAATAVGFNLAMLEIGTLLGPPGFGLVADLAAAYRPAWFLLAAVMAAGTLVAILATRGERRLA